MKFKTYEVFLRKRKELEDKHRVVESYCDKEKGIFKLVLDNREVKHSAKAN